MDTPAALRSVSHSIRRLNNVKPFPDPGQRSVWFDSGQILRIVSAPLGEHLTWEYLVFVTCVWWVGKLLFWQETVCNSTSDITFSTWFVFGTLKWIPGRTLNCCVGTWYCLCAHPVLVWDVCLYSKRSPRVTWPGPLHVQDLNLNFTSRQTFKTRRGLEWKPLCWSFQLNLRLACLYLNYTRR